MELSLVAACLAKIPADRILSFRAVAELLAWVQDVRAR
jgi:hypothetical protein